MRSSGKSQYPFKSTPPLPFPQNRIHSFIQYLMVKIRQKALYRSISNNFKTKRTMGWAAWVRSKIYTCLLDGKGRVVKFIRALKSILRQLKVKFSLVDFILNIRKIPDQICLYLCSPVFLYIFVFVWDITKSCPFNRRHNWWMADRMGQALTMSICKTKVH